jgi:hypothetical protein
LPKNSDSTCPDPLPQATTYLIKPPGDFSGKCVTAKSNSNNAPVTIEVSSRLSNFVQQTEAFTFKNCAGLGTPNQKWSFQGSQIKVFGNKCLDVTDGHTYNGVKLQIYSCGPGNGNQEFVHSGGRALTTIDRISWKPHPEKCVDLTDGDLSPGNKVSYHFQRKQRI